VDVAILSAFAAPFMAMLSMLWHQQRAVLKQLSEIGRRLARVEGFLGIGMPAAAAAKAPGADLARKLPEDSDENLATAPTAIMTPYLSMSSTDSAMAWPSSGGTALPICFAI
jgi:hypothetical protein